MNLKVFRAIKTNICTQGFYENANPYYKQVGMSSHGGWDWAAREGEPVYFDCVGKGFVLNTEIDTAGGLGVNIITENDEGIFKHRYWHLKKFNVVAGQEISVGHLIGWCDNTGMSTGTHLHRDTKEMIKDGGAYKIKNPNNGTFGTIDYSKYFINTFVGDVVANWKSQVSIIGKLIDLYKELLKKV